MNRHPLLRARYAMQTVMRSILAHATTRRVHLTLRVQGRLW